MLISASLSAQVGKVKKDQARPGKFYLIMTDSETVERVTYGEIDEKGDRKATVKSVDVADKLSKTDKAVYKKFAANLKEDEVIILANKKKYGL